MLKKRILLAACLWLPLHALAGLNCGAQIESFCRDYDEGHMGFSVSECVSDLNSAFSRGSEAAMAELKRTRNLSPRGQQSYYMSFYEKSLGQGVFPANSWNTLMACANQKEGGGGGSAGGGEKKKDGCKAPPDFRMTVKKVHEFDNLYSCIVKVWNDSPYPVNCQIKGGGGYRMLLYPGQNKFYSWQFNLGGEQTVCEAEVICDRKTDPATNKPVRYGECQ